MRHGGARVTGAAALTLEIVFRINAAKISHDAAQGHYASPQPPPLPSPRSLYGHKTTICKSFSLYSSNFVTLRLPYYVLCRSITSVLRKFVTCSRVWNMTEMEYKIMCLYKTDKNITICFDHRTRIRDT